MSEKILSIENIWLADGTGSPLRRANVIVSAGRISAVAADAPAGLPAPCRIDGKKQILAPGFIDAHGHSDISLMAAPEGFSKVSQGITTEISGNCGLSPFPLTDENREHIKELYANYNADIKWSTYQEYLDLLSAARPSLNLVPLCGHNSLRAAVCGYGNDPVNGEKLEKMCRLLADMLRDGIPGMSSGLLYVPGRFAGEDEIIALMKTLALHNGIYTTHLRSESSELVEALTGTVDTALRSGLKKIHISHFKTARPENWHKLDAALEVIAQAGDQGIRVTLDRYPYCESMSQLSVILPPPWDDLDDITLQKKLQDPETILHLAGELRSAKTPEYWQLLRLTATGAAGKQSWCGRSFAAISPDPALAAVELLAADAAGTTSAFAGMSEENMERIIALDNCMMGSDGNALPADGTLGSTHPRSSGSAARFMRLLLDSGMAIEKAVYKMTGLTAETFALTDRGGIRPGKRADLVLFDPDSVDSKADFVSPFTPAEGIIFTMNGGSFVYRP